MYDLDSLARLLKITLESDKKVFARLKKEKFQDYKLAMSVAMFHGVILARIATLEEVLNTIKQLKKLNRKVE